jgi:tRNA G18 (ribose-2'-O)-methylase SpoU
VTPTPIATLDDPRLDPFRSLRATERHFLRPPPAGTREVPCFVAEGARVVDRALAAGCRPLAILVDGAASARLTWASDPALPVVVAERELIRRATGLGVIRGAIGIFARPPARAVPALLDGAGRVLVVEGVANPVNLGVIIRSAAALGVDATLCDSTCADPLYRRAVRGSMGAVLTHPWARLAALPHGLAPLRDAGYAVVALVTDRDAEPLEAAVQSAGPRVALLLGAEGHGISAAGRAAADGRATIPMCAGVDSLSVGAAAAVACYVLGRVR